MLAANSPSRSLFAIWTWPRWTWGIIAAISPIAYALSVPPLFWLMNQGYLPFESYGLLLALEKPLIFACEPIPPLWKALVWYDNFWNS